MVDKFFQRTVLRHLALVGIGYFILHLYWRFVQNDGDPGSTVPPHLIVPLTLIGAICFPRWVKKYRPIPRNPIQQFFINLIIASYSIVVALCLVLPLFGNVTNSRDAMWWPVFAGLYVFYTWKLVYEVDLPIIQDATGRRMSAWEHEIHQAKQRQKEKQRSTRVCGHY